MKLKTILIAAMAAIAFTAVSCEDDNQPRDNRGEEAAGTGSITVSMQGQSYGSRALGSGLTDENKVVSYRILVFNHSTGALEKAVDGDLADGYVTAISGLNVETTKRVVVIANPAGDFKTFNGNYADLDTMVIDASTQTPLVAAVSGLMMVGESAEAAPIELEEGVSETVVVNIHRVVAKVIMDDVFLINPPIGLTIGGIGVQRGVKESTTGLGLKGVYTTDASSEVYYDGLAGGKLITDGDATQLAEFADLNLDIELDLLGLGGLLDFGHYFYVLPNQGADLSTMLTLHTISVEVAIPPLKNHYYPIEINAKAAAIPAAGAPDGTGVKANSVYRINATIKNFEGGTDPDEPIVMSAFEVDVNVDDWALEITQNVEF